MGSGLEINGFLESVEATLARDLADDPSAGPDPHDTLMGAARHLCLGGAAKRARPLLVRLFGEVVGAPADALVSVAVAAELIHSASLLHDDVVDTGMFRRARPTVNARWGNVVAVMGGDLLLATALSKLREMPAAITHGAVQTVVEMTRGAIVEVESRGDLACSVDRLRFVAEGKTGALFGWCGAAAAQLAGNDDARQRFDAFGRRLGVAFQIADDIRDLNGTDPGKPRYADIQSRTLSVPIVLAAQKDERLGRELRDAWAFGVLGPDRARALGEAVMSTGALELALARMDMEIAGAIDAFGHFAAHEAGAELVGWAHRLAQSVRG
jgi:geranylgeranyl pyrophosphate synthase